MRPDRGLQLYEGKAKRVFATSDPSLVIMQFKDDATAFNGVKKASIVDKGRINCAMTEHLFREVESRGFETHLVERISDRELLCRKVTIIPVEVVVRNRIAGGLAKRYGKPEGGVLPWPLVEYFYKSDELNDPLMTEDHAVLFGWAERRELEHMKAQSLGINEVLKGFWGGFLIDLIDFKLEFGRVDGRIVLADELTADGARLWERGTGRKLDKDVFRRDLGDLSETYRELYARVFGHAITGEQA
jgi:phosphoribosylaminoimidazole-succinocarboxamide synthase